MDFSEKMNYSGLGFREYVETLEEERKKIQVFQKELPYCLELVTQSTYITLIYLFIKFHF